MMQPTSQLGYEMALARQNELRRTAEQDHLAQMAAAGPTWVDRLCAWAGEKMISLGARLERRYQVSERVSENWSA